ncbi:MAG: hypothetical protein KA748_10535 [Halomonas sp.]|nr:hypothetical protein [Halomonas sp.]MBP5980633.1 hypothetical protein [Halomonas sp.]
MRHPRMAAPSRPDDATQPRHRYALLPRRAAAAGALALTTRYMSLRYDCI